MVNPGPRRLSRIGGYVAGSQVGSRRIFVASVDPQDRLVSDLHQRRRMSVRERREYKAWRGGRNRPFKPANQMSHDVHTWGTSLTVEPYGIHRGDALREVARKKRKRS